MLQKILVLAPLAIPGAIKMPRKMDRLLTGLAALNLRVPALPFLSAFAGQIG